MLRDTFRLFQERHPDEDLGQCVHGEFGSIDDWGRERSEIAGLLSSERSTTEHLVDALLAGAPADLLGRRDAIVRWVSSDKTRTRY